MTQAEAVSYWRETAQEDLKTIEDLFSLRHYHYALFFCQLALERLLKGLVIAKSGTHPLPIHRLMKLVEQAGIKVTEEQEKQLDEITRFNIEARYEDYKREFYKKSTPEYSAVWIQKTKDLFLWLKQKY